MVTRDERIHDLAQAVADAWAYASEIYEQLKRDDTDQDYRNAAKMAYAAQDELDLELDSGIDSLIRELDAAAEVG